MTEVIGFVFSLLFELGKAVEDMVISFVTFDVRLSLPFLLTSLAVAYLVFRKELKEKTTPFSDFISYLELKNVYLHPSAINDYVFYILTRLGYALTTVPFFAFFFYELVKIAHGLAPKLAGLIGPSPFALAEPGYTGLMVFGLASFIVGDFIHYVVHRIFHVYPSLWEFHKVHHSAEVLVPPTAARVHPVEYTADKLAHGASTILCGTTCFYLYGENVTPLEIFGINYIAFFFNILGANLRHTNIWLSFGPVIEHVINSPAQHQIHHSTDPLHYNKNMGTNLSLWDWIFGTLYITQPTREALVFGLGEEENKKYRTLYGLFIYPFIAFFKRMKRKLKRSASTSSRGR